MINIKDIETSILCENEGCCYAKVPLLALGIWLCPVCNSKKPAKVESNLHPIFEKILSPHFKGGGNEQ